MNLNDKSKEELIIDLQQLQQSYDSLKQTLNMNYIISKQVEKALLESEERYQLLFDKAPLGYQSLDFDGFFIEVNQQWLDTLGYQREEVIGKWFGDFLTPAYQDGFRQRFPIFKAQGHIHSEFEMQHKNGSVLFIAFEGKIGYDLNGEFKQTHCILQNITERKKKDEEIKKTGLYYQALIEKAPDGIALIDTDGKFKYISPAAKKMFGYMLSDEVNGNPSEYTHPDDLQMVLSELGKIFADPTYIPTLEYRFIDKQGQLHWVETTFSNLLANPNVESIVLNFRDITERKLSEALFKDIVEKNPMSIQILDMEGFKIQENTAHTKLFGVEPPSGYSFLKDTQLLALGFDEYFDRIKKGEVVYFPDANYNVHNIDSSFPDSPVWVSAFGFTLNDNNGKPEKIVLMHENITERKNAESLLNDIIEKNPMSIQILDMEGYPIKVNTAHTKLFGVEPPSGYSVLKDTQLLALGFDEYFDRIKKGEVVYFPDSYYNVHDVNPSFPDSPVWVKALGFTLNDNNGKPEKIVLMHENITERKNAEALLNDIIENNPMSIQIVDKEGHTLRGNPAFIQLFGSVPPPEYSIFEDLKTKNPEMENIISRLMDGEIVHLPDIYFNAHDTVTEAPDIPLWIRALIFPLKNSIGKPEHFVFMHENITESKIAEQELIKAKEQTEENKFLLQSIIDNFPGANITLLDKDLKIKIIGGSEYLRYNLNPNQFINKPINMLLSKRIYKSLEVSINNALNGIDSSYTIDYQDLYYLNYVCPLTLNNNEINYILVATINISELKKTEFELIKAKEKAQESDRLKSAFLANMSHEIRTPMNGILGFADLLKDPELSGEQQQQYLKIIEKSGARMLNIINDIIDISKIEAGLMNLDIKETNINEQIEYIFTFFKPEVEAKGMKLTFYTKLPKDKALITTDREKLYAILTNLVKNAIKYSKEGNIELGYNLLKTDVAQSVLEFYVKDSGIGIPKDRQQAIFERFVQADIEDEMARQGAGLGLAITKSYVEMLGGKIRVESEEGVGSCFYFTLPYIAYNEEITKVSDDLFDSSNSAKNLKILIAEDDETSETLLSILLVTYSKDILKVKNGMDAIEICRQNPDIDLIMMDIRLPLLGGYEATKQIREFNKEVIIIAQTAFGLSGDREKALEAGCNDYISKPIKKNLLKDMIDKYFKK